MPKPLDRDEVKTGGSASTVSSAENLPAIAREVSDHICFLTNVCTACASRLQCEAYQRRCPLFHQPQNPEQASASLWHLVCNAISVILSTAEQASQQALSASNRNPSGESPGATSRQKYASKAMPEGDLRDRPKEKLLVVADVIDRTKLSLRKLRYEMASGALPYIKIGRSTRFAPADVDAYIEARRINLRRNYRRNHI